MLIEAKVRVCDVQHLRDLFPNVPSLISPLSEESGDPVTKYHIPESSFIKEETFVLQEKFYTDAIEMQNSLKFLRAGARKMVCFKG
mmetsp:Transcript_45757/g.33458  ORF Transcript_45757/g.33458 Transcript_45757/m.33458 type:complete len:86 (+) Transcript_45757:280-537(+)